MRAIRHPAPSTHRVPVGAILAGGESLRMGRPKQSVPLWDGRTMLDHTASALSNVCRRVVIVGGDEGAPFDGALHIPDRWPGQGPLAGLEALLESGQAGGYLVVACDQPLLRPEVLRRLVERQRDRPVFFRSADGVRLDPFPGWFPASLLIVVQRALERRELSVRRLVDSVGALWVTVSREEEQCLRSINTPEELNALLSDAGVEVEWAGS